MTIAVDLGRKATNQTKMFCITFCAKTITMGAKRIRSNYKEKKEKNNRVQDILFSVSMILELHEASLELSTQGNYSE